MTDPDGNVTGYAYDEAGRLAVTQAPAVTAQAYGEAAVTGRPETTTGYDTFGDITETQDPNGNTTRYAYDGDGRVVTATPQPYTPPGASAPLAASATATTTAYDGLGQVTSQTTPLGTTSYGYDQLGDLASVTPPDGHATSYQYYPDRRQQQ